MVYYISWSSQCVVAWFPGSEDASKLSLPADKEVEPKLYPAVPSSPGCGLLGQRTVFESSGNCVCLMTLPFLFKFGFI